MKLTGLSLVVRADEFADHWHNGQTRADKVTPYITHPREVSRLFEMHWLTDHTWSQWSDNGDQDMYRGMALAKIHDVWEDTDATVENLHVAGLGILEDELNLLTRGEDQAYLSYILAIKGYTHKSIVPFLVKLCDIEHNRKDSESLPSKRRKHALLKYELASYILTHD